MFGSWGTLNIAGTGPALFEPKGETEKESCLDFIDLFSKEISVSAALSVLQDGPEIPAAASKEHASGSSCVVYFFV